MPKQGTVEERFWRYVTPGQPDECWLWTGYVTKGGYGQINRGQGKGLIFAHRLSWELHHGPIPTDMLVCHVCDNPICVNPAHLFTGTDADNLADMRRKGRERHPAQKGSANGMTKLTEEQVIEIRRLCAQGVALRAIAPMFGISYSNVGYIVRRKTWTNVP